MNKVTSKCQMNFLTKTWKKNVENRKSEYYHRILQIWNSLGGTKFKLKLKISNIWTKLIQKGFLPTKNEKKRKSSSNSTSSNQTRF